MANANPFGNTTFTETRKCVAEFNRNRDQTRTVSFPHPTGNCIVCNDKGGLEMKCGHYMCPDDILEWTWKSIDKMKFEINCYLCPAIITIEDIIKFGLPTEREKLFITTAITTNFYESQDIKECPQCKTICSRTGENPQVQCIVCPKNSKKRFTFCWYCLDSWKNKEKNKQECGNEGCRKKDVETLVKSPMKKCPGSSSNDVVFPQIRACPNIMCSTLIEHASNSRLMVCKCCKNNFCFVCLSQTKDGTLSCIFLDISVRSCSIAPAQIKLPKKL